MRDFQDGFHTGSLAGHSEKDRSVVETKGVDPVHPQDRTSLHRGAPAFSPDSAIGGTAANRSLLNLQRSHGNRYVQRVVNLSLQAEGDNSAPPDVQQAIESSRGGGHPLDGAVGAQLGKALNADFSGVRVHTDGQADALNRALNAKAFTTGKDVFFRHGEYNPGSSTGKQLLAHELTHVVQQNPDTVQRMGDEESTGCACGGKVSRSIQTKLTVGHPGDIYEQEADQMAQAFPAWEQRAGQAPDAGNAIRRAVPEEEKKKEEAMVRTKPHDGTLWRQPEEEKKKEEMPPVQAKFDETGIRRQEAEEEG